ncbi:hypothetical protein F2Q70_00027339 [Brassica cretica]|uniref:Uncharacterized protein n=1 Tax=Brassica cretica TaxID=69181 RepID=A0A8S9LAV6_BRACR|nr:hypothetical protein F2Q70_00027339 [Brassica cretica]KAF3580458.1 hypothetical protein DY000_02033617 [Brassica cretica]
MHEEKCRFGVFSRGTAKRSSPKIVPTTEQAELLFPTNKETSKIFRDLTLASYSVIPCSMVK